VIVTTLADLQKQMAPLPHLAEALDFLRQGSWGYAKNRVDICGQDVFALLQSYETKVAGSPVTFEAHRQYLDIQYLVEGEEIIFWKHSSQLAATMPYDDAKDFWLGQAATRDAVSVHLTAGQLAVFFPTDAHAAMYAADKPGTLKKIVIKIILSD
jgi:YhcH/YjgK/YiaL family protein